MFWGSSEGKEERFEMYDLVEGSFLPSLVSFPIFPLLEESDVWCGGAENTLNHQEGIR